MSPSGLGGETKPRKAHALVLRHVDPSAQSYVLKIQEHIVAQKPAAHRESGLVVGWLERVKRYV